jgi:hypothetical protein
VSCVKAGEDADSLGSFAAFKVLGAVGFGRRIRKLELLASICTTKSTVCVSKGRVLAVLFLLLYWASKFYFT